MRKIYFVTLLILVNLLVKAQTDTTFWFVAPESSEHPGVELDRPISLHFYTHVLASTITISQPANPSFVPIIVSMGACSSHTVDLTAFIDSIENKPANQVNNFGLYIHGTNPFSAYYEINGGANGGCGSCNTEFFSLKGKNALGAAFYVPLQTSYTNDIYNLHTPVPRSAFDILATENGTNVTVTPTEDIVGHAANIPFSITLNRGQTFSCTAVNETPADHATGSSVTANKPISVTVKDDELYFPGYASDMYGDQLIPVSKVGTEYILVKVPSELNDLAIIIATQNNTQVYANGALVTTLNTGQSYQYALNSLVGTAIYLNTTYPAYVFQISTGTGEFGSAILPSISYPGSSEVVVTRTTNQSFWVNLITRSGNEGGFLYNGASGIIQASSFSAVPGTGGAWKFAQIDLTSNATVGSAYTISNNTGLFQMALIQGVYQGSAYAYFSDFSTSIDTLTKNICTGNQVTLNSTTPNAVYLWNTGLTTDSISASTAGTYWVRSTVGVCRQTDTFYVTASTLNLSSSSSNSNCTGNTGSATVNTTSNNGPFTYLWSNGGTSATIANLSSGTYTVTVTDASGCNNTASANVSVTNGVMLTLSVANAICNSNNGTAIANISSGTAPFTYLWSNGGTSDTISNLASGTYTVTVTDNNSCTASSSTTVNVTNGISLSAFSTNTTCGNNNGSAKINPTSGTAPFTYLWSNGASTDSISNLSSGTYTITVNDNNGCSATSSVTINPSSNSVSITSDKNIMCSGDSAHICATGNFASYLWNTGQTGMCIYAGLAGNYYVTATDVGNCTATSNHLSIGVYPLPPVSISVNGDTLVGYNAVTYQWYLNGTAIPNATSAIYIAYQSGNYTLAVTDSNGCLATSTKVTLVTGIDALNFEDGIKVFPNPNETGSWQLVVGNDMIGAMAEVNDIQGRLISKFSITDNNSKINIDASRGIYLLHLSSKRNSVLLRLVKL